MKKTNLWHGLPILRICRQLGSEPEIKFMEALDIQKNATQFKESSTPKLTQGHPYFLGNYLGKLFLPEGSVKIWHQTCLGSWLSPGLLVEPPRGAGSSLIRERKTEAYSRDWGLRWPNEHAERCLARCPAHAEGLISASCWYCHQVGPEIL